MNEAIVAFQARCGEVAKECQKFCFMSRAKELQAEAREALISLEEEARVLKEEMIAREDEDSANAALSLEAMMRALANELGMWIALKEDKPGLAWDELISAQNTAGMAMRAHHIADNLGGYVERLHAMEKLLFPPQVFFSPGMVIDRSECSICGKEYSECDHIKGKAYMGKMCTRIIKEVKELREISVVYEPIDKRCRIHKIIDEGVAREPLSGRIISDTSAE
jgi:hypothetical protein